MLIIFILYGFVLPQTGNFIWFHDQKRCEYIINFWVTMYFGFMDVTFPFITLYLFIKPIKALMSATKDDCHTLKKKKKKLLNVTIKYSIITAFAIMSTLINVSIYTFFGPNFTTPIDAVINGICILLYEQSFDKYYHLLFSKFHNKIYSRYKETKTTEMNAVPSKTEATQSTSPVSSNNETVSPVSSNNSKFVIH
eukprot:489198_1